MRIWKGTVASGRATSREFESRFVPCKTTISWKNVNSNNLFNLLTPRSDKHVTSPYSMYIIQQTGNENTQTHQVEDITLIDHQLLVTN